MIHPALSFKVSLLLSWTDFSFDRMFQSIAVLLETTGTPRLSSSL